MATASSSVAVRTTWPMARSNVRHERRLWAGAASSKTSARWRGWMPDCSWNVLRASRRNNPAMHTLLVNGNCWRRKPRISECADRNTDILGHCLQLVVDGCSTVWTEVKIGAGAFVTYPHILGRHTGRRDVCAKEPCLLAKGATRAPLASQAVTYGDTNWISDDLGRELTATT